MTTQTAYGDASPAGYQIFVDDNTGEYVVCLMGALSSVRHCILDVGERFGDHSAAVTYVRGNGWKLWTSGYNKEDVDTRTLQKALNIVKRRAVVANVSGVELKQVRAALPSNYRAEYDELGAIIITGYDVAGWTLDEYVIPRLASGLITAVEA